MRWLILLFALAGTLLAANIKLYLTDGTYHLVREYEVQTDRVRFYSVERSAWEEIPLELIDLDRTHEETAAREEERREVLDVWQAEREAEHARQQEVASVPDEVGVYFVDGDESRPLAPAELEILSDKKRAVLKAITPVPVIAGKKNVVVLGERSAAVLTTASPEFYIRLDEAERFGIIQLTVKKGNRHVETWNIIPVSNQVFEEHEDIEVFRREVGYNLYKIWPRSPLPPGEYAVIEFSPGEANVQAWDFSIPSSAAEE
jgi:hypothetical protein